MNVLVNQFKGIINKIDNTNYDDTGIHVQFKKVILHSYQRFCFSDRFVRKHFEIF